MKKLVKPTENVDIQENLVETLCNEHNQDCPSLQVCIFNGSDTETEEDIVF